MLIGQEYVDKISQMAFGDEKISFFEQKESILESLTSVGFNGYHFSQIVLGADWQEKLNWAKENYRDTLKPLGFNQAKTAKILKGKGWEEKISWIEKDFENSSYTVSEAYKILQKKDWKNTFNI